MGQRTYRNKLRRYQRLRQNQTEQQYEYLTERHVICPSHPKYAVLDHFSHLANNVYNQGLYRAASPIQRRVAVVSKAGRIVEKIQTTKGQYDLWLDEQHPLGSTTAQVGRSQYGFLE